LTIRILLTFIITIFSHSVFSTTIRVLDFQHVIENNTNLFLLYEKIEKDQETHKVNFNNEELNLENEFKRIEKLNLILESSELEKEIENYNLKLNKFNDTIQKFNLHYDKQVNDLKNKIINIILDVLKKYSEDNKIDLILDSNSYILSSNSINITTFIIDQVNKKKIEISFEKYK
jgi:Skp family chaperone for outer membrane proteins